MLELVPISISDANVLVKRWHRHREPAESGLFALAVADKGVVCGAAIVGRPVARGLQDGWTAEVTRLVTDGTPNACSMLYAAAWRACRALGYRRLVTYTLQAESGSSLLAAGWKVVGKVASRPRGWHCEARPRVERDRTQAKFRWEAPVESCAAPR